MKDDTLQELFQYFEAYCEVDDQSNQQPHQPLNLQEVFNGDGLPKFQYYPIEEGDHLIFLYLFIEGILFYLQL